MVGFVDKQIWFCFPEFLDGFVWCFEPERLELLCEVVRGEPVAEITAQFPDRGVVEGFGCRVLDGSHHALGLLVGPEMVWLGQTVLDAVLLGHSSEDVREPSLCSGPATLHELHTIVREGGMDLARAP